MENINDYMNWMLESDLNEILGQDKVNFNIIPEYEIPLYVSKRTKKFKKILVLSGGGIKGIAHVGAFKAMEELNYLDNFEILVGTSVGSLMIALYVAGYRPDELYEFIKKFDLGKMKSINILNVLQYFGLDCGERIDYVIRRLIKAKGINPDITLADLYELTNKKVMFTTVCLNTICVEYLSHENYPNLPFYKAIRMSLSIPWFYTPVKHEGKYYVDGGIIDNYPIQIFKSNIEDVLGVYLAQSKDTIDNIDNIETFTLRVFHCFMEGVNYNSKKGFERYTIDVNLEPFSAVNYGLDTLQKELMFKAGYDAVMNYLK